MPAFYKSVYILLFFLFSGQYCPAQQSRFDYLTTADGLSQNTVRSITKDKYGFMWFATWNGLCRYDGYTFKVYRNIPGDSNSLYSSRTHYLYKDSTGTLWVTTFNYYVCRYNYETDNFTRFKANSLPKALRDSTDRQRNLDIFQSLADKLRQFVGPFSLSATGESFVFQTSPGSNGGLNDRNVNCAYEDDRGTIWLGTTSGGVNKIDYDISPFQTDDFSAAGIASFKPSVRAVAADSNSVWVGMEVEGLLHLNKKKRQVEQEALAGRHQRIRCLLKDSRGNLWIGSRTGLQRYDSRTKEASSYFDETTITDKNDNRFYAAAEDPTDHSVWFGTFNSLLRYDPANGTFQKWAIPFSKNATIVSLFFDSKGHLWLGTEYTGLIQLVRKAGTNTWADTVRYTTEGSPPHLPDNRVYSIAEDKNGTIWAGTANGLCRIDPASHSIKVYTQTDGFSDQYIAKVLPDGSGNIWVSHKKGLSQLNTATGAVRNYTIKANGREYEFLDGSGYADTAADLLYFGGMEGLVSFQPAAVRADTSKPIVRFTDLQVLNKGIAVGETVNDRVLLPAPLYLIQKLELTHNEKSFSIEFAALQYTNPGRCRYAYQLQGWDKDWVYTDAAHRMASYSNMPPGHYRFQVKASNSDGIWNPEPATLEVVILPPWWRTGWAYAVYLLLLALLAYSIFRLIQKRQQYQRQILMERLKAEKAQEVEELKSRFFTNVSHEFRTPLTLLIDPLERLVTDNLTTEKRQSYYHVMSRNAHRLLTIVNQFLDFRKLETGNLLLQVERKDIVVFVKQVSGAFALQAEQQHIHLQFKAEPEELPFAFDADVVSKIVYNLLSNAFKFTPEGGSIQVALTQKKSSPVQVVLSVTDNGPGIPPEHLQQIFDPFFQVAENKQRGGTGVGLALTREMAARHRGGISVQSQPNVATTFTVLLASLEEEPEISPEKQSLPVQLPIEKDSGILQPEPETKAASEEKPVILLVEDSDDIRGYLADILATDYTVVQAPDGTSGLQVALDTVPDLIVSDVMMPGMDGFALCKAIKTTVATSHIPVVLLTARQNNAYQIEGYNTGADAYVGKPFSTPLLLARIGNLLASRKMLRELFGKTPGADTRLAGVNEADKAFIGKATALIENHMADGEVSVEWLAEKMLLSRTQLYRKMKALTNQSVHDFSTAIRLNKAAEWLLEGTHTVSEIAYRVGYSDANGFSRAFQKQFGETPKKYSQQGKATGK